MCGVQVLRKTGGRTIDKQWIRAAFDFILQHPSVKPSPRPRDSIYARGADGRLLKDEDGCRVRRQKLIAEESLTVVYLSFVEKHGRVMGERTFRKCAPAELRRLSVKQRNVCACRCS